MYGDGQGGRGTDTAHMNGAFREYANAPKTSSSEHVKRTCLFLTSLVLQGSTCEELFKHRFGLPSGLSDVTSLSFAGSSTEIMYI
jgi:hypothetical protein